MGVELNKADNRVLLLVTVSGHWVLCFRAQLLIESLAALFHETLITNMNMSKLTVLRAYYVFLDNVYYISKHNHVPCIQTTNSGVSVEMNCCYPSSARISVADWRTGGAAKRTANAQARQILCHFHDLR